MMIKDMMSNGLFTTIPAEVCGELFEDEPLCPFPTDFDLGMEHEELFSVESVLEVDLIFI